MSSVQYSTSTYSFCFFLNPAIIHIQLYRGALLNLINYNKGRRPVYNPIQAHEMQESKMSLKSDNTGLWAKIAGCCINSIAF